MKKLLTMMSLLLFCVVGANAQETKDVTIFVKAGAAPYLYTWNTVSLGEWPGKKMEETTTVKDETFYKMKFSIGANEKIDFIINNGMGGQTGDLATSFDCYFEYDGNNTATERYPYIAAGDKALWGTANSWDIDASNRLMTVNDGKYSISKEGLTLAAGTYESRYVKGIGKEWAKGSNKSLTIPTDGIYTVTMTVNGDNDYTVTAEKTGDIVLPDATIESVQICGAWTSWATPINLVKGDGNVWTGTVDLASTIDDQEFKLVVNDNWLGTEQLTLDGENPSGWITAAAEGTGQNFKLTNSTTSYQTYTVTATWVASSSATAGWTLTIAGKDERAKHTATFVNGKKWAAVRAYAWKGVEPSTVAVTAAFPGLALTKAGTTTIEGYEYDVYSFELASNTTNKPDYIIFSDGSDVNKTADLAFVEGKQYNETVPPTYTVTFKNTPGWEKVYAYAWNTNGDVTAAFPGDEITDTKSGDIYTYKYTGWNPPTSILFDDGTNQTSDFTFENNKQYEPVASVSFTMTKEFESFSSKYALDFSETSVKAYRADIEDGKVKLYNISKVPANTGVILKGAAGEVEIPTTYAVSAIGTNLLVAANTGVEIAASTDGSYNYVLATQKEVQGFYNVATAYTMTQDGKAYLHTTTALADEATSAPAWIIEGDVTGIESVTRETITDNAYYNLAGQRVAQPTKGLYIVNGKKVIVK